MNWSGCIGVDITPLQSGASIGTTEIAESLSEDTFVCNATDEINVSISYENEADIVLSEVCSAGEYRMHVTATPAQPLSIGISLVCSVNGQNAYLRVTPTEPLWIEQDGISYEIKSNTNWIVE